MKKLYIVLLICPFFLFGQQDPLPTYKQMIKESNNFSFYDIQDEYNSYFQGRDQGRGSGYKQVMRLETFLEKRVYPTGQMINVPATNLTNYQSYLNSFNFSSLPSGYDPGYWQSVGHGNWIEGETWAGGIGRVNCIAFSNSDCYIGAPAGGVWKATSSWVDWEPITDGLPNIGVSGIAVNPNNSDNIFILTGDGDGYSMSGVGSIGVLESSNGGITWERTALSWPDSDLVRGYKLLMHPNSVDTQFVVVSNSSSNENGIYRTTDGWDSFTRVATSGFYDIEFHPTDPTTVYASTDNDFYISTNTGASFNWSDANSTLPTSPSVDRVALAVTPAYPDAVYLLYGDRNTTPSSLSGYGFYVSISEGAYFTEMTTGNSSSGNILGSHTLGTSTSSQASYDLAIAVSPQDPLEIHVGGINMWKSTDLGNNWEPTSDWKSDGTIQTGMCGCVNNQYTHADIHALEYHPTNGSLYCGSDGGFYRTTDQAQNWEDRSNGLEISMLYAIDLFPGNSNSVIGGTQDNGSSTWNFSANTLTGDQGADGFACIYNDDDSDEWFMTTQSGVKRTLNNGSSFSSITPPHTSSSTQPYWDVAIWQHTTQPNTVFCSSREGNLWVSTSAWSSTLGWQALPTGNTISTSTSSSNRFNNGCVSQGVSYSNRMYAASGSKIFMTADLNSGTSSSWSDITSGLPVSSAAIAGVAVNPSNSWQAYVVFSGYSAGDKVYRTTNCGGDCGTSSTAWTDVSGSLPNVPINCVIYDPNNTSIDAVYIGTDVGIFYRDNNMGDWVPFFHGLPNVVVEDLAIENNQIVAGTYGRGVWKSNLFGQCLPSYTLGTSNNSSANNALSYYAASNWITSEQTIHNVTLADSVIYQAGDYIELLPGFNTQSGADFEAKIDDCGSSGSSSPSLNFMNAQQAIIYRTYGTLVP